MTKCTRYRTYIQTCMCFTAAVLLNVVVLACGRVDEPGHLVDECSSRLVRQAKRIIKSSSSAYSMTTTTAVVSSSLSGTACCGSCSCNQPGLTRPIRRHIIRFAAAGRRNIIYGSRITGARKTRAGGGLSELLRC